MGFNPIDADVEPFIPAPTRKRIEDLGRTLQGPVTVAMVGSTVGLREEWPSTSRAS